MFRFMKLNLKRSIYLLFVVSAISFYFGVFTHFFEEDFETSFRYPYDGDISEFVQDLRLNLTPRQPPINSYNFKFYRDCRRKCDQVSGLRLVYLVKSSPEHFRRRAAIRHTWGYERRFSDVEIRTVFLIGETNAKIQATLDREADKFKDIVQGNFTDSYFNNTLKTMMGFQWAIEYCKNARFYMFVDDDYYVSTKNVLRYVRNPVNYPDYLKTKEIPILKRSLMFDIDLSDDVRLYTGYTFKSAPHRHLSSKWYISLEEYPYDTWPPYVTAGAYILSHEAILDMYYASFYTKHFKFDDIYVALLALKCKIRPFHSDEFYFYKLTYNPKIYRFVVASHGFGDPDELSNVWTEQRSLGNA